LDPGTGPNDPEYNYPERSCFNNSYNSAAQTPSDIFWGWTRFFNLMDTVLLKARDAPLIVDALDYFNESNMSFTVQGRMIYDKYRGVDVLQELRNRMSLRGFDPARVAPSATAATPQPASFDCGSWWGDSAMMLTLTLLEAAIAGPAGRIGETPISSGANGLACYDPQNPPPGPPPDDQTNPNRVISLPVYHTRPTFIDIHSQKAYPTTGETAAWAKNFYSDIWSFLENRVRTGDYVVFGESNPVEYGSEWTPAQAEAMLYGIPPGTSNGYKNSTLFINHRSSVVMRPWHRTEFGLTRTLSPHKINPPYNPFLQ